MVIEEQTEIECGNCGTWFLVTSAELDFRREHDMDRPTLCPVCRAQRRSVRYGDEVSVYDPKVAAGRALGPRKQSGGTANRMYNATCDQCGGVARVPFIPRGDRPVYCRDCYNARKGR